MKLDLEPLTAGDLVVGTTYLKLSKYLDGTLALTKFTMLEEPDETGKFRVHKYYDGGDFETDAYLESCGCPARPRVYQDNFHRTFTDSPEAEARLRQLVRDQDLTTWLEFVGVKNVEATKHSIVAQHEQFNRYSRLADEIADSDPLGSLDLMVDLLHSMRVKR